MATLRTAPTRHRHTEQFSGILTDPILTQPTPRGREGWEKPKHKLARKQQAIATTLCEELQASNCVYKSRGAPARGIGPPLLQLGKQLTSITSRLTVPKLHLATCIGALKNNYSFSLWLWLVEETSSGPLAALLTTFSSYKGIINIYHLQCFNRANRRNKVFAQRK